MKLHVIEIATGKCIKCIDVSGKSARHVDRVISGLEINMDLEHYFVDDHEFEPEEEGSG